MVAAHNGLPREETSTTIAYMHGNELSSDDLGLELFWYERVWDLAADVSIPETRDFDPKEAQQRAKKFAKLDVSYSYFSRGWTLSRPPFEGFPNKEEAQWWLDYFADEKHNQPQVQRWFDYKAPPEELVILLRHASGQDVVAKYLENTKGGSVRAIPSLPIVLMWRLIWDRLSEAQRRDMVEPYKLAFPDSETAEPDPLSALWIAALTSDLAPVRRCIAKVLEEDTLPYGRLQQVSELGYFAETAKKRVEYAKHVQLPISRSRGGVLLWLANTGAEGFDYLVDRIDNMSKEDAKPILALLSQRLHGPGAVPLFVKLTSTRHAQSAIEWLRSHLEAVLASELTAEQAQPLASVLRGMGVDKLRAERDKVCPALQQVIDELIAESELLPFDPETPWWVKARYEGKAKKFPTYAQPAAMAPLILDDARLGEDEMAMLLAAMQTEDRSLPIFQALREHVPARTLDAFAVHLLQFWLDNGAVAKDRWLMTGAGCLGGDDFVLTLTPLIRAWPGESQHKRATYGLDALRNVGSDLALQQIAGIAAKVKFAGIKKRAAEAIEEIAASLGLTRDQLEDRIIPDGGLDASGRREFSYGPRSFVATLTPECKVVARLLDDAGRPTGKPKTSLPSPNKSDDPELAATAKKEFSLLKKSLTSSAKIQALRFEQALISGRRWTSEDFQAFFAPNPLVRSLLAGIVWATYHGEERIGLGRLDEGGELIDANDAPVDLEGVTVGIVHPGDMSEEEKAQWGEVLADFELQEAFPQLSRPTFELPADQGEDLELHAVATQPVDTMRLIGALKRAGWQRGAVLDNGIYTLYFRHFDAANVTAVIHVDQLTIDFDYNKDTTYVEAVYLLEGLHSAEFIGWGELPSSKQKLHKSLDYRSWQGLPGSMVSEIIAAVRAAGA